MDDSLSSFRKQLAEAEGNLRLIEERMSEYVRKVDIPLQDIKEKRRLEKQIADLKARLAQLMAGPCPYRGLEPFEAEHAEFYFGRQAMVERLVAKVGECPFVAVVGPSGCGKSSLVRAGLVTALQEGALPDSQNWAVRLFRPGADPLRALSMPLVALLEPEATEVTRLAEARKLAEHLRGGTLTAADVAARLREKYPDLTRLVLVADQFEELYTECGDETLRQAFVEALLAAAAEEGVAVVLALRADFFGRVLAGRQLGKAVDAGLVNVLPMNEEELQSAVEQPALKVGRAFEPGLVARILEHVAGEPGNLPLLEFALMELWRRQAAEGVLTHAAYEAIGGVAGAIARRAEPVYKELEGKGKGDIVRRIFLRLTRYGDRIGGMRRRATLDNLVTSRTPRAVVRPVVKILADARLVVTARDEATGQETAEVAHEALIHGWERLQGWLADERAFGLWRDQLAAMMKIGLFLRDAPLAEAERWLTDRGDDLNEAERAFVEKSLALREQEEQAWQKLELETSLREQDARFWRELYEKLIASQREQEARRWREESEELAALHRGLDEVQANLDLIRERMSRYVLSTDVPLQLVKEERHLARRARWLERRIEELRPINLLRRATKLLVGPVAVALTGGPLRGLRQRLLSQASKLPRSALLDVVALGGAAEDISLLVREVQILLEALRIEPNPGQLEALERRAALLAVHLVRIYRLSAGDLPELTALTGAGER